MPFISKAQKSILIICFQQIEGVHIYADSNQEGTILEKKMNLAERIRTFNDRKHIILSNDWNDAKRDLDYELLLICTLLTFDRMCKIFAVQLRSCRHLPNMIRVIICSHQAEVFTAIRSLQTLHNRVMMTFRQLSNSWMVQNLSGRTNTVHNSLGISSVDSNDIYVRHRESSPMPTNMY